MKKLVLAVTLVAFALGTNAFAEPTTKSTNGHSYVECETAKSASDAAEILNKYADLYSSVSAPSVTVTNTGDVIVCVTHTYNN